MTEPTATVTRPRQISRIWLLPLLVILIGGWVTTRYYLDQGPSVDITFATAEGLEAGRTRVRALSVDVGVVKDIRLADDLNGVKVRIQLNPGTDRLMHADTQFWVVRPRLNASGVSGLGTLLSGPYIELYPGNGERGGKHYTGLDEAPHTPPGVAGMRVELYGNSADSISVGAPILHRGLQVGQVESVDLDMERAQVRVSAFIDAPFDQLVTEGARFWNASGLSVHTGADGLELDAESLAAVVSGGIAFAVPSEGSAGEQVESGSRFELFASRQAAEADPYLFAKRYVLQFEQSLRGLEEGAAVEYRGIRVGTVERIRREELAKAHSDAIAVPVIIRVEPGRFGMPDNQASVNLLAERLQRGVADVGMRASLQTGNLITGGLYVSIDHHPDAPAAEVGEFDGMSTLPTLSGGIKRLGQQLSDLLDKLNALPLEQTTEELNRTLASARATLQSVEQLTRSEAVHALPEQLNQTLETVNSTLSSLGADSALQQDATRALNELDSTLRKANSLLDNLQEQPSSLLFPIKHQPDPEPRITR